MFLLWSILSVVLYFATTQLVCKALTLIQHHHQPTRSVVTNNHDSNIHLAKYHTNMPVLFSCNKINVSGFLSTTQSQMVHSWVECYSNTDTIGHQSSDSFQKNNSDYDTTIVSWRGTGAWHTLRNEYASIWCDDHGSEPKSSVSCTDCKHHSHNIKMLLFLVAVATTALQLRGVTAVVTRI